MNLLLFLPGRVLHYYDSFYKHITVSSGLKANRYLLYEDLESILATKSERTAIDNLLIQTHSLNEADFWQNVFEYSQKKGRLYIHHLGGELWPVECFVSNEQEWSKSFAMQFIQEKHLSHEKKPAFGQHMRFFVYVNPGEPYLQYAQSEAQEIMEILAAFGEVRFVNRKLCEHEYYEILENVDCMYYFGHARFLDGHPLIELRDGWTPMFVGILSQNISLFVLAACLETQGALLRVDAECCLYPVTRIADRKSSYILDFTRNLLQYRDVALAYKLANSQDIHNNDIRRFIYRLQGNLKGY